MPLELCFSDTIWYRENVKLDQVFINVYVAGAADFSSVIHFRSTGLKPCRVHLVKRVHFLRRHGFVGLRLYVCA